MNRSDDYNEGTLWDCKNITTRRFPYYTTRKARTNVNLHDNVTAIYAWDKLIEVDGKDLCYDGVVVGEVEEGAKQFAVVNTKLVIFPDKKYLDFPTKTLVDMVARIEMTGTITVNPSASDTTQTVTVANGWNTYRESFSAYADENGNRRETVEFTLTKTVNDEPVSKTYDLQYVWIENSSGDLVITFRNDTLIDNDTYESATFQRKIPDFEYICSSDNRIWGCKDQTIYASELGDPTSYFYLTDNNSASSWAGAVTTPSKFTGCVSLGSSVVFFKEHHIHKVLGSSPSEYSVYSYDMEGIKDGCAKSAVVINDNVFYLSQRGVMIFSGGNVNRISEGLGDTVYSNGVGGTDGVKYYLSCYSDKHRLFTYDSRYSAWLVEDHDPVADFTRYGDYLYMVINKRIVTEIDSPMDEDWFIQFNDMYESDYNNYGRKVGSVLNKKNYSKLVLRVEMGKESHATIKVRTDGGLWKESANIVGRDGVFTCVVPINRCDKFGIMIEGRGEFTLLAMSRSSITESVRNE